MLFNRLKCFPLQGNTMVGIKLRFTSTVPAFRAVSTASKLHNHTDTVSNKQKKTTSETKF